MPAATCCVVGCNNRHSSSKKLRFYRIPRGKYQRSKFIKKIGLPSNWLPNNSTWICSVHFKSGKISKNRHDVDYIPTLLVDPARDSEKVVKFPATKCLSNSELLEGAFRDHITHLIDEASIMLERREQEHLTQSLLFHDYLATKTVSTSHLHPDNPTMNPWITVNTLEERTPSRLPKHHTDDRGVYFGNNTTQNHGENKSKPEIKEDNLE